MLKPKLDHISILNVVFKYNSKKYSSINYESDNTAYLHKHLIPAVSTLVGDDLGLFCSDGTWTPRGH